MSVDKFKFISPGIFVHEIDNTGRNVLPGDMGPVLVGRSEKGPILRPTQVNDFADFDDFADFADFPLLVIWGGRGGPDENSLILMIFESAIVRVLDLPRDRSILFGCRFRVHFPILSRDVNAREDHRDPHAMIPGECFAQKSDGHQRAEHRRQIDEIAGRVGADAADRRRPENLRQQ